MNVIAINGSPRKEGNTSILLKIVLAEIEKEGIETESLQLGGEQVYGCRACFNCVANKDRKCSIKKDVINDFIEKMVAADGILIGSPTYFCNVSTEIKALIDRAGLVVRGNDYLLKRKLGAAVVAVRRAGSTQVFDAINQFFTINQMIIPGANYWNVGMGRASGDVERDEEGIENMKILGQNMAWLLKKINN